MDIPFYHLDLNIKILDWRSKINDFNKKQKYVDRNCNLLDLKTKKFFYDHGIFLTHGNLWSWPPVINGNFEYHIDGHIKDEAPLCAINILLEGSPSVTEWIEESKVKELSKDVHFAYGSYTSFSGIPSPDYYEAITYRPMLVRIDVPHRVREDLITETRWTYSIRMKDLQLKQLEFNRAKDLLKEFII